MSFRKKENPIKSGGTSNVVKEEEEIKEAVSTQGASRSKDKSPIRDFKAY